MRRRIIVLVTLAIGCNGPLKEFEQYRQDMCACTSNQCVEDVDTKYDALLNRPASFVEKHLVTKDAEAKIVDAFRGAETCANKYRPSAQACGGESAEKCPRGYRCVSKDPKYPDAQGTCTIIHQELE